MCKGFSDETRQKIEADIVLQAVETVQSEADEAAEKAGMVEAESAFVPDAGLWEIEIRKKMAFKASSKAVMLEDALGKIIHHETR